MTISAIPAGLSQPWSLASPTGGAAASDLETVRSKGLLAFAADAKKEAWVEKLKLWREQAMKAMGLSDDRMGAMSADERSTALQQVNAMVEARVKDAMDSAKAQAKNGLAVPNFVDLSA